MKKMYFIKICIVLTFTYSVIIKFSNKAYSATFSGKTVYSVINKQPKPIGKKIQQLVESNKDKLKKLKFYDINEIGKIESTGFVNPFTDAPDAKSNPEYKGTSPYMKCQTHTDKRLDKLAKEKVTNNQMQNAFHPGWKKVANNTKNDLIKRTMSMWERLEEWKNAFDGLRSSVSNESTNEEEFIEKISDLQTAEIRLNKQISGLSRKIYSALKNGQKKWSFLQGCMGLSTMAHYVDYGSTGALSEQSTQSFDGRIKCVSSGAETQDYRACSRAVMAYNAAFVGQKGMETVQSVVVSSNLAEEQFKLATKGTTLPSDMTKNSLYAAKKGVEEQKKVANQRAVFHGVKLAAVGAIYATFPTLEDMLESCQDSGITNEVGLDHYKQYINAVITFKDQLLSAGIDDTEGSLEKIPELPATKTPSNSTAELCKNSMKQGFYLAQNQHAKSTLQEIMVTAGVDIAAYAYKGKLLGDQADRYQSAINGIEDFKPEDFPGIEPEDILARYCVANPQALKCSGVNMPNRPLDWGAGGMNVSGGNGRATTIGGKIEPKDAESFAATRKAEGPEANNQMFIPNGGINKPTGFSGPSVAAAIDKPIPGGGGGAGGSAALGPGSVGAPSGGDSKDSNRNEYSRSPTKIPSYRGGKSGFRYLGGKGINKETDKKKNPFADFFKNKNPSAKGGDINLIKRAIASKKDQTIWYLISDGYKQAEKEKKLLEYEVILKETEEFDD